MVDVRGEFCIDRYESVLVDVGSGQMLSPYYHPTRAETKRAFQHWRAMRHEAETAAGRRMPVPAPPLWQLDRTVLPRAEARAGVIPQGYLSADVAERACLQAGKRLCSEHEWVLACRGERATQFPYGATYVRGACNVAREAHPANVLHGNASVGHRDPRLNQVKVEGRGLLRRTGATPRCRSTWGDDAAYDMVGNLAEWIADSGGTFVGGFYSRASKNGCDRRVSNHPRQYFDYSLGVRCCR